MSPKTSRTGLSLPLFSLIILLMCMSAGETATAQLIPNLGSSRSGTSGFQFLKINPDARSAALGGANVADAADGSALYLNPALAAQMPDNQIYVGHTQYFADISLNYASYVHRYKGMAFGGSLMYLDSGEMDETTAFAPTGTGLTFRTVHLAAGLSFAQQLTNLFSYGITTKYLNERIENVESESVVFDVGFFYRVGDTGLQFAVGLNNFGLDATPGGETIRQDLEGEQRETDFEDISPPTTFRIGASYDTYTTQDFNLITFAQITNPSDNAERFSLGSELEYLEQFFVRAGYEFGVDEALLPSFGAGFKFPISTGYRLGIDYGFSTRDRLGSLHRFALKFDL